MILLCNQHGAAISKVTEMLSMCALHFPLGRQFNVLIDFTKFQRFESSLPWEEMISIRVLKKYPRYSNCKIQKAISSSFKNPCLTRWTDTRQLRSSIQQNCNKRKCEDWNRVSILPDIGLSPLRIMVFLLREKYKDVSSSSFNLLTFPHHWSLENVLSLGA